MAPANTKKCETKKNHNSSGAVPPKTKHTHNSNVLCKGNSPVQFQQLAVNTDLNEDPPNSSRCHNIYNQLHSQSEYKSFQQVSDYLDYLGKVDVVTNSTNIKNLLKMAYTSNSHLSLVVHRVGKTLFIDEFDVAALLCGPNKRFKHLISAISKNFEPKPDDDSVRTNEPSDVVQSQDLFLKFLEHSIDDESYWESDKLEHAEEKEAVDPPNHQNLIWNFGKLCMLIGTDFPNFGNCDSPCTSLSLTEANKPINVLTGIDLWLDNLISNVPEVLMCYHVRGIVQEYKRIKTEDLPKLPSGEFSPSAVVDMAQNVFNFLAQNVSKEGHTYWLFKAKDDMVKLYDVTSISQDFDGDLSQTDESGIISPEDNPYSVPVAVLLYKVSCTMRKSNNNFSRHSDMRVLLEGALGLDPAKHAQVYCGASYLLADIFVPFGIDPKSLNLSDVSGADQKKKKKKNDNNKNAFRNEISLKKLRSSSVKATVAFERSEPREPLSKDMKQRCDDSINFVVQAIKCIKKRLKTQKPASGSTEDEEPRQAESSQSIPMPDQPLSGEAKKRTVSNSEFSVVVGKENFIAESWEEKLLLMLLQKAAFINHVSAMLALDNGKIGVALYHLQLTIACWMAIEKYSGKKSQEILPLRVIVGDFYENLAQLSSKDPSELKKHRQGLKKISSSFKAAMNELVDLLEEEEIPEFSVPHTREDCLDQAVANYKVKGYDTCDQATYIQRCLAEVLTDSSMSKISVAEALFAKKKNVEKAKKLLEESIGICEECLLIYEKLEDNVNLVQVHCNLGRIYKLLFSHTIEKSEPYVVSKHESELYRKACFHLAKGRDATEDPKLKKDLSKRLGSISYTYAKLLLENPSEFETKADALKCAVQHLYVCMTVFETHEHLYLRASYLICMTYLRPEYTSESHDAMKEAFEFSRFQYNLSDSMERNSTFEEIQEVASYVTAAEKVLKRLYPDTDVSYESLITEHTLNFRILCNPCIQCLTSSPKKSKPLDDRQLKISKKYLLVLQRCISGIYYLVKYYKTTDQETENVLHRAYMCSLNTDKSQEILPHVRAILNMVAPLLPNLIKK